MNYLTILQYDTSALSGSEVAGLAAMGTGMMVFAFILYLFFSFCLYKIFQKAGIENAWGAFIPIYSTYLLTQAVKVKWWWLLLALIPYVNILVIIYLYFRLSKFFGKDWLYVILLIFAIGLPILAFSDAKYLPDALPDER